MKAPTPVLKELSLKGLSFLRSRSAPPTPRDQTMNLAVAVNAGRATESPAVLGYLGHITTAEPSNDTPAATPSVEVRTMQPIPTIIIERDTPSPTPSLTPTVPDEPPAAAQIPTPTPTPTPDVKKPVPVNALGLAASLPHVGSVSRSVSPAPSLEAILLDRKRRLGAAAATTPSAPVASAVSVNSPPVVGGGGGGTTVGPARVAPAAAKGARFKSSPLGGGERTGVVVAEQVKEKMGGGSAPWELEVSDAEMKLGSEEGRIAGEKDKEGPDKTITFEK